MGCIGRDDISIGLSAKDKSTIDKFKKEIKYTGPIKSYSVGNKNYTKINLYGINNYVDNLKKYWNITERKSNTLMPPNLCNEQLIYSYIIGYFDGDGTAYWSKNRFFFGFNYNFYMKRKWLK